MKQVPIDVTFHYFIFIFIFFIKLRKLIAYK